MKKSILILLLIAFAVGNLTSQKFEMVKDFNPDGGSYPHFIGKFNDKLYYFVLVGEYEDNNYELWSIDNNLESNELIKEFPNHLDILYSDEKIISFKDKFYFVTKPSDSKRILWESDGTSQGTKIVKDVNSKNEEISIYGKVDKKLLFFIKGENNIISLISLNPVDESSEVIKIFPDNSELIEIPFVKLNNKLVFTLKNYDEYNSNFWITDGTSEGTKIIEPVGINNYSVNLGDVAIMQEEIDEYLYFTANEYGNKNYNIGSDNNKLWKSDGTAEGTKLIKDINPDGKSKIRYITESENKVYFKGQHDLYGTELWITDGTEEGTKIVKDINSSYSSYPAELFNFNKKLYFRASPDGNEKYLWTTDGTEEGTKIIKELNNYDVHPAYPEKYPNYDNKMYFSVDKMDNGIYRKLSYIDKNENIVDLTPDFATEGNDVCTLDFSFANTSFIIHQDFLYFCAKYNDAGYELWRMNLKLTDVEENITSNDSVKLFPNPAKSFIKLQLNKLSDNYSYKIFNSLGNVVSSGLVKSKEMKISTEHLVTSMYVLNLYHKNKLIETLKFMKIE